MKNLLILKQPGNNGRRISRKFSKNFFKNSLKYVKFIYPKVNIKKSLCNPCCEVFDRQFGELWLTHVRALETINQDFVGQETTNVDILDDVRVDRFIKVP